MKNPILMDESDILSENKILNTQLKNIQEECDYAKAEYMRSSDIRYLVNFLFNVDSILKEKNH